MKRCDASFASVEVRAETTPVHASSENANEKWHDMNKTCPDNHEMDGEEEGRPRGENGTWVKVKSRNKGSSQRRSDTAVLGSLVENNPVV